MPIALPMAYAIGGLAGLIGTGSMLALAAFLFGASLAVTDLGLNGRTLLAWDTALSLAFFIQHSGMIRRPFGRRLERVVPRPYHGAFYTVVSGVLLLMIVSLWQASAVSLVELRGGWRWAARAIFVLSIGGMGWGALALGRFDAFGLDPILAAARGTTCPRLPLVIRGPYRWVRHPLYLFMLLLIWSCPDITTDRLLFNVTWTIWIAAATVLEERDLVADHGDAYRAYQRRVPMLVPRRIVPSE